MGRTLKEVLMDVSGCGRVTGLSVTLNRGVADIKIGLFAVLHSVTLQHTFLSLTAALYVNEVTTLFILDSSVCSMFHWVVQTQYFLFLKGRHLLTLGHKVIVCIRQTKQTYKLTELSKINN